MAAASSAPAEGQGDHDTRRDSLHNIEEQFKKVNLEDSASETSLFHDSFDRELSVIGKGGFGKVFKVRDENGELFAVKRIILKGIVDQHDQEKCKREVKILSTFDHENVVRYYDCWVETHPPGWLKAKEKDLNLPESTESSLETESYESEELVRKHNPVTAFGPALPQEQDASWSDRSSSFGSYETSDESSNSKSMPNRGFYIPSSSSESGSAATNESASSQEVRNSSTSSDCEVGFSLDIDRSYSSGRAQYSSTPVKKGEHFIDVELSSSRSNAPVQACGSLPSQVPTSSKCESYLYIKMELCQHGDRYRQKNEDDCFSLKGRLYGDDRKKLNKDSTFTQVVDAVVYIHSKDVIHRDLKPSNIFFAGDEGSESEMLKIGDFGLARYTKDEDGNLLEEFSPSQGTGFYKSPEIKTPTGTKYNEKTDIFSLGVIVFEMFYRLGTERERADVLKTLTSGSDPHANLPPDAENKLSTDELDLIRSMLAPDPKDRPSARDIQVGVVYKDAKDRLANPEKKPIQATD